MEGSNPEPEPVRETNHVVITVHGIRTYGNWQADLKTLLEAAEPGVTVLNYQYGYFSSLAFLVPPLRWLVARQFRRFFVQAVQAAPEGARIDLVAHSFGTYLAASAIPHVPKDRKINTVIFAGSVLRPSFPWYRYHQAGVLKRVVNECGWDDAILLVCQSTALMMGMAGRVGFQGMVGGQFMNRYYRFGHGGYFDRDHRLMRENWIPLLTGDAPIMPIDNRPKLTAMGGAKLFLMNNLQFIKIAAFAVILMAVVLIPMDWARKADYQKRVERFANIARLANAVQIPGRDPGHVRDLLRVDVKAGGGERSIDHIIGTEATPDGDDVADEALAEDDFQPRWWEAIPGLHDDAREAYRARQLHARANYQLAAGKRGNTRDLSKAKLLFEDAIRCYRRVNVQDPANGSFALCLMDYGLLLKEMQIPERAVEQFRKIREDVFPRDATGESPSMPRSLVIDSLGYEASAMKSMEKWDEAAELLLKAVREARGDHALLSFVYNELAWLKMERMEIARAQEYFLKAQESCETLVENGQFVFKTRLYHIRHGLAMAERLCGRADESYGLYDQLVKELQELMRKDMDFSPKERRDLRMRMVNSMERRADVRFFARKSPAFFPDVAPDRYFQLMAKVEDDYQEAIDQVANDDLPTKAQLLYKKVIARCLTAMSRPPAVYSGLAKPPLEPIDIEFAEAERTYNALSPALRKGLKLYHTLASCCMNLQKPAGDEAYLAIEGDDRVPGHRSRYAPRAVETLRSQSDQLAANCESLNRERVEMLLVAQEVLLEVGLETGDPRISEDASRMLAVLGATTKIASHHELRPYVQRFNRIAGSHLVVPDGPTSPPSSDPSAEPGPAPAVADRTLFYLRISPTRAIVLTDTTPPQSPESKPEEPESRTATKPDAEPWKRR